MNAFFSWADRRNFVSVRVFMFALMMWMTWLVTVEAWNFATLSRFDGLGTSAVIAAVTAPFAALQAAFFKTYMDSK